MAALATILSRTGVSEISFRVDEVKACRQRLPVMALGHALKAREATGIMACSHADGFEVVQGVRSHALVEAVHLAFSQHRPLLLTPDAMWMTIAQGLAQHVNNHAEALRSRFVHHQGKMKLVVVPDRLSTPEDWVDVIARWGVGIRGQVGPDVYRMMVCNFTTTTPTIRTASEVVMMEAFQQYFDYALQCICGIPTVTVRGSVEDWRSIYARVQMLQEYDLDWWTARLLPICRGFIETAAGRPPLAFWQDIYKPRAIYGGEVITGWLADLFPYLTDPVTNQATLRNPALDAPRESLTVEGGLHTGRVPSGLSRAPFTVEDLTGQPVGEYELVAGFLGVAQASDTGHLSPEIGWLVHPQHRFTTVLSALLSNSRPSPRSEQSRSTAGPLLEMPKELVQLVDQWKGRTLFAETDHPWHFKHVEEYETCPLLRHGKLSDLFSSPTRFVDLEHGRCLAYMSMQRRVRPEEHADNLSWITDWWVVVGTPVAFIDAEGEERQALVADDTIVVATGIEDFVERLVEAKGCYYFDDPEFIPPCSPPSAG